MANISGDRLQKSIVQAMESETRRIVDEEAKNAATRVEERVRGLIGQIATKAASWVEYSTFGNELRITVRLPDRDEPRV